MNTLRVRIKPYIQPFERILALRELQAVAGTIPRPLGLFEETSTDFEILSKATQQELAARLAYWESVEYERRLQITTQSLRESTVNLARNGATLETLCRELPFKKEVPLPSRRCLRYGTHGLHEYRGKFFPQLVRALINIGGGHAGSVVADPMIGSGTTVIEALLEGYRGLGLDMNPLSVFIGNTKARILSADVSSIVKSYDQVCKKLRSVHMKPQLSYFKALPKTDQNYLTSWFSEAVLSGLDHVSIAISEICDDRVRDLMRVCLSNILRRVSWQKLDDLRVRKEVKPDVEINPKKEFLEELGRSVRSVVAFLYQNGSLKKELCRIELGDARRCSDIWGKNEVDLVITSPPYATALPYLDTDRLSLCYLGLLPRPEHRPRDHLMIGNREVSESLRKSYWTRFKLQSAALPKSVQDLVCRIDSLNSSAKVGFRRRNLPALLAKYFFDMQEVLAEIFQLLKRGGIAFVVIGNNHTFAGEQRVEIRTAALLQEIAETVGFEVGQSLSMDMLVSRDIFRKNTMSSEEIITLRRSQM